MSTSHIPAPEAVAPRLLAWLATARRDLPWRRRRDPYAVWVSEIMLQQTQVATVIPYFERWLARFPDVATLAAAPLDDVLKAWEGLGYYGRARNLHRAARLVAAQGGELPSTREGLRALPGVGDYTAGAILSLAFGAAEPAVDGNVRRVLARVYDIAADAGVPGTVRHLWTLAEALVAAAPGRAGDLNEGLMELGALVCLPKTPDCPACPLSNLCLARARGTVAQRPVKTPKPRTPHYDVVAAAIRDDAGRYLLAQRPPDGLLGGLWGFPGGIVEAGEALEIALARTVAEQTGIQIRPDGELRPLKHAYTHFRITLHPFRAGHVAGEARPLRCAAVRWVAADELAALALPVTDRKIALALARGDEERGGPGPDAASAP